MKGKDIFKKKSLYILVAILIIFVVSFSINPGLLGKLLGQSNVETVSTKANDGNGVVINSNPRLDYGTINYNIYNGSKKPITVTKYVYRNYCATGENCEELKSNTISEPITINAEASVDYAINDDSIHENYDYVELGFEYTMDDQNYVVLYPKRKVGFLDKTLKNTINDEKVEQEFIFKSTAEEGRGNEDLYMKISDNNVYMDISENLENIKLKYYYKSDYGASAYYNHPQHTNALTSNMFGESNKANIVDYFSFDSSNTLLTGLDTEVQQAEYSDNFSHTLVGTPRRTVTNVDVIPGFFYRWFWKAPTIFQKGFDLYSSNPDPFSAEQIPHFRLTVYNKAALEIPIEQAIKALNGIDIENIDVNSFNNLYNLVFNKAIPLYQSRSYYGASRAPVTQEAIDKVVYELNTTGLQEYALADYSKYNALIAKVEALNEDWYPTAAYQKVMLVYNESENYQNINAHYQVKLDNYVERLEKVYNELVLLDADYTSINNLINNYRNSEGYTKKWYTASSRKVVDDYIKNIDFSKKKDEQELVESWAVQLNELISKLELIKALGYLDSDDYKPFENAKSVETMLTLYKNVNRNLYNTAGLEIVDGHISEIENNTNGVMDITINRQAEMDSFMKKLYDDYNELDKKYLKGADYTAVDAAIARWTNLDNKNIYTEESKDKVLAAISAVDYNKNLNQQEEVDKMAANINSAIDNLKYVGADYSEINKILSDVDKMDGTLYNNWKTLKDVIDSINWNLKYDEQELVNNKVAELLDIISKLEYKPADYTEVQKQIGIYLALKADEYKNFEIVEKAVSEVVYGKKINEQSLVDQMAKNIQTAISKLIKIDTDPGENPGGGDTDDGNNGGGNTGGGNTGGGNTGGGNTGGGNSNGTGNSGNAGNNNTSGNTSGNGNQTTKPDEDKPSTGISDDKKIDSITINDKEIILNGDKATIDVDYETKEFDINVILKDKNSKYEILGNKELKEGKNIIYIKVTAADNTTATYTLRINRAKTSNYLSELKVNDINIHFDKNKEKYKIIVKKGTDLDISYDTEDEKATVKVIGKTHITKDTKVQIVVTDLAGQDRVYEIEVKVKNYFYVIFIVAAMVIAGGTFAIVKNKKKN